MIKQQDMINESIRLLQQKQALQLIQLKDQFHKTYESLKPLNLIKSTLHEATDSSEVKNDLLNNVIELASTYLSKKLLGDTSHSPIKRTIGTLLEFAMTTIVGNYSETIIASIENLLHTILSKKNKPNEEFYNNEC
jgi:hypothetical protein